MEVKTRENNGNLEHLCPVCDTWYNPKHKDIGEYKIISQTVGYYPAEQHVTGICSFKCWLENSVKQDVPVNEIDEIDDIFVMCDDTSLGKHGRGIPEYALIEEDKGEFEVKKVFFRVTSVGDQLSEDKSMRMSEDELHQFIDNKEFFGVLEDGAVAVFGEMFRKYSPSPFDGEPTEGDQIKDIPDR